MYIFCNDVWYIVLLDIESIMSFWYIIVLNIFILLDGLVSSPFESINQWEFGTSIRYTQILHQEAPWHLYLHDWLSFRVNVGKHIPAAWSRRYPMFFWGGGLMAITTWRSGGVALAFYLHWTAAKVGIYEGNLEHPASSIDFWVIRCSHVPSTKACICLWHSVSRHCNSVAIFFPLRV